MRKTTLVLLSLILALPMLASEPQVKSDAPAKEHLQNHFKFYGFIRNYFTFDTRESVSGTGNLFYYLPKDESLNSKGEDLNAKLGDSIQVVYLPQNPKINRNAEVLDQDWCIWLYRKIIE